MDKKSLTTLPPRIVEKSLTHRYWECKENEKKAFQKLCAIERKFQVRIANLKRRVNKWHNLGREALRLAQIRRRQRELAGASYTPEPTNRSEIAAIGWHVKPHTLLGDLDP